MSGRTYLSRAATSANVSRTSSFAIASPPPAGDRSPPDAARAIASNSSRSRVLDALGRREHPLLVLLERGRHIALSACQRLSSLIVRGNQMPVGVADLDVVAEDFIVADLERRDPSARAFCGLNLRDRVASAIAQCAQLVERAVDARTDRVALTPPRTDGRSLHECRAMARRLSPQYVPRLRRFLEQAGRLDCSQHASTLGQTRQRVAPGLRMSLGVARPAATLPPAARRRAHHRALPCARAAPPRAP